MLTNEIRRLIRNLVEAAEESEVDQDEVTQAVSKAFELARPDPAIQKMQLYDGIRNVDNSVLEKVRKFVEKELTSVKWNANKIPVLLKKSDFEFVVEALYIYYRLNKEQSVVDINDWIDMVGRKTRCGAKKAYRDIHTKLKPCLGTYMKMKWQSKRIDKMMARFYQEKMEQW